MRITIVAVGRLTERFWSQACEEYLKRLGAYARVTVIEVPDRAAGSQGVQRALEDEAAAIRRVVPDDAHVIALDIHGATATSEAFSARLAGLALSGRGHVAFVIGGSHGVAPEILALADERLSFGPMTLPHNLARVVLLEQVYRAFRIMRDEPYHK